MGDYWRVQVRSEAAPGEVSDWPVAVASECHSAPVARMLCVDVPSGERVVARVSFDANGRVCLQCECCDYVIATHAMLCADDPDTATVRAALVAMGVWPRA